MGEQQESEEMVLVPRDGLVTVLDELREELERQEEARISYRAVRTAGSQHTGERTLRFQILNGWRRKTCKALKLDPDLGAY
jgi:hypothetical protein